MTFVRSLPAAACTRRLHTTRHALRAFDQGGCRRILDVGCGDAFFEAEFPGRFVGIDVEGARVARRAAEGVPGLLVARGEQLPFRTGAFDGLLAKDVLEHLYLEQAFAFLAEARRVLAPGGLLVVVTFQATQSFWDKPDHVRPYSSKWLRRVMVQEIGGFTLVEEHRFSAGIPGFGRLGIEDWAHRLAQWFGVRHDHGLLVLRRT